MKLPNPATGRRHGTRVLAMLTGIAAMSTTMLGEISILQKTETNDAKNLARMNCGAKIECITPDGRASAVANATEDNKSAAALIMDDDTLSCPLQEGETTFIISLANASMLDRFKFVNENAAARGELKIAVSNYQLPAASPKWVEVDGRIAFTNKRLFNLSMVGVEARYVKLSFNVEKGGRIASLGLYGDQTLQRFAQRQHNISWVSQMAGSTTTNSRRLEDRLNFNFANLYAKARVVYVSSGIAPAARRMIDDDAETGFRFASTDPHPTVIVELADSERLNRVSARYQMGAGRLNVYLLNKLAENPGDLGALKPIASVADENAGKAAVDFNPQGARYVALRWTPTAAGGDRMFEVAEINAFGDMPLAMLTLNEAPDLYASSASAMTRPGESNPDISNSLGTIAVAPVLPEVSP